MNNEITELMTAADVARQTGRTPAAVRLAADTGRIEVAMRTLGGIRLFTPAAVEQYRLAIERRRRGAA